MRRSTTACAILGGREEARAQHGTERPVPEEETSRAQLLKTLPRAYTGSHVKSPFVETARGTKFTFESEHPMEVYADGERLTRTPVTFALEEGKLRIVVP